MNEKTPVSFPEWKAALAISNLTPVIKASHNREILTFLHHCKKARSPATVVSIKQWLVSRESRPDGPAHTALRWFYRTAPKVSEQGNSRGHAIQEETKTAHDGGSERIAPTIAKVAATDPASPTSSDTPSPVDGSTASSAKPGSYGQRPPWRPMEPRPAAQDLGASDWERALVGTLRVRGLLSRTEDTYRSWARRFARFIAPKTPYAAGGEEVGTFLTDLAVKDRASPSSQRQALNALVFLMQESLGRQLGEIDFKRAYPRVRVPSVLTPEECQRTFTQMESTTRLMAELMYGSGIRLMELLRLRVHHLDLDRGQLAIRSGKRDKDRVNGFADAVPRGGW